MAAMEPGTDPGCGGNRHSGDRDKIISGAILPLQQDDRRHGPGNLHEIFQAYRAADRSGAGGSVLLRCAAAPRKHRRGAVHFLR